MQRMENERNIQGDIYCHATEKVHLIIVGIILLDSLKIPGTGMCQDKL